jgi:hypothetical protein
MSTSFNTIFNDMKTSLGLASRSILSYFLAGLGMLIVVGIIFALVAAPIAVVAFLTLAPLSEASMIAMRDWVLANPLVFGAIGISLLVPIVSLFMVMTGSIYGMSHDLVTTGETKAESAFSYFRRKFLAYAGASAIMTIIIIVPPLIVWGLASYAYGFATIAAPTFQILTIFTFVWVFITAGLTSMVFPAVSSGKGVQEAVKESYSLATRYFDRVFGLLSGILLLLVVSFGPMIVWGITQAPFFLPHMMTFGPVLAALLLWTVVSAFLWILLFLPMVRIAWVKVYQELTGGQIATLSVVNDVPIV